APQSNKLVLQRPRALPERAGGWSRSRHARQCPPRCGRWAFFDPLLVGAEDVRVTQNDTKEDAHLVGEIDGRAAVVAPAAVCAQRGAGLDDEWIVAAAALEVRIERPLVVPARIGLDQRLGSVGRNRVR